MTRRRYVWPPRRRRGQGVWVTWALVLVVASAAIGSGCSSRESEASLQERARRYWELKQSKRWEEVYDGFLDSTLRQELSKDAFLKKRLLAFDVLSFTITEAKEQGDTATVSVVNEVDIPVLQGPGRTPQKVRKTVTTRDQWVRREGRWYLRLSE